MKKTIAILPLAALVLTVAACSSETTNVDNNTNIVTDLNSFDENVAADNLIDEAGNAGELNEIAVNNG